MPTWMTCCTCWTRTYPSAFGQEVPHILWPRVYRPPGWLHTSGKYRHTLTTTRNSVLGAWIQAFGLFGLQFQKYLYLVSFIRFSTSLFSVGLYATNHSELLSTKHHTFRFLDGKHQTISLSYRVTSSTSKVSQPRETI